MLIFYTNLGQGGPYWYLGPLLMLLPFILGGGFLSLPLQLLSLLFSGGGAFITTYVYDSATGWQQAGSRTVGSASAGWMSFVATLLLTLAFFALGMLAREMHRHGVLPTLRRLLLTGWHGGGPGQRHPRQAQRGGAGAAGTQQQRFERVTQIMQSLPTEVYHSREELQAMSVAELKGLLRKTGEQCKEQPLEKGELIDCLQYGGNSTATSCSICCEDYAAGDVLRVLRCKHRFHLECIDRWLLSSADYSRPPACPMCNAELEGVQ